MTQPAPLPAITADARNRALRTFLQGLAFDVVAALAAVVVEVVTEAPAGIPWAVLGLSLVKTLIVTAAAYVMRAKLDPSSFPTPLPPADPGPPAEPEPTDRVLPHQTWQAIGDRGDEDEHFVPDEPGRHAADRADL